MSDSIDELLLDYYQQELSFLRLAGSRFAENYPKVARRLALSQDECPDPHVERLLEGFALLSARLHRSLDDEYSQLTDALLEQLYPYALRPVPSTAILRFDPDPTKGNIAAGYPIPRGTALHVTTQAGDSIHFRTAAEATLWPVQVEAAMLVLAEEAQAVSHNPQARAALKLSLSCLAPHRFEDLPLETLRIHLAGSPVTSAALYDLLCANAIGVSVARPGEAPSPVRGLPRPLGFEAEEALLPAEDGLHPAYRLLVEYFACPEKFAFFDLPIRMPLDAGEALELVIAFDKAPASRLTVRQEDFALGCTPAVNLFPRTSEPLRPDGTQREYRLVADAHREASMEIYAIRSLRASKNLKASPVQPYFAFGHTQDGPYWHARRVTGLHPDRLGSDMLLTFVDPHFQPAAVTDSTLTAELLCTNRYLAQTLPAGTKLSFERPGPVANVSLLRQPSPQTLPALGGASRWRLVSQLSLNHLSLVEDEKSVVALQEMLALHNLSDSQVARRQIEGLSRVRSDRVVAQVGEDAWRGWRNGLEVRLAVDPERFVGASPVLFSGVLAHFFSLYANANRFVRTVLEDPATGMEIKSWQTMTGEPLTL
ncbi:type VI secretion system baseplate subunit TssF [Gallaecimonas kandeliae]|uniref:type VI secretion system baseplate subunit TssF n=1 Tax=Gallaecimonas kandeliae TaxID=3029055 RepID=UPI00264A0CD0|nr:type VI secretion system baseplate subunit TssF [Gallaecimonas kandeliae]WKE64483.1 type VI secretion system baseplate subunit TssF [Gallaecimonas kandeliae]